MGHPEQGESLLRGDWGVILWDYLEYGYFQHFLLKCQKALYPQGRIKNLLKGGKVWYNVDEGTRIFVNAPPRGIERARGGAKESV